MGSVRRRWRVLSGGGLLALALTAAPAASAAPQAPGAPGTKPTWEKADKHGFGTSATLASKVWFTLRQAELSEVYYPDLGTPALRDLEFAVTDGRRVERETRGTRASVRRARRARPHLPPGGHRPARALAARRRPTSPTPRGRHGARSTSASSSLTGRPYRLYVLADPALGNDGADDRGRAVGGALVARDDGAASALAARARAAARHERLRGPPRPLAPAARRPPARGRRPRCAGPATSARRAETALTGTGSRTRHDARARLRRLPARGACGRRGARWRAASPRAARAYARGWQRAPRRG